MNREPSIADPLRRLIKSYLGLFLATVLFCPEIFAWTDDPLNPGMRVKPVHVQELRDRIDAIRTGGGCPLGPYPWATGAIASNTRVRADQIREIRTAVLTLVVPPIYTNFTDPTLTSGVTPVRAIHIVELRRAIDNASCIATLCPNGVCDVSENCITCPADCSPNSCGNHCCDPLECGPSGKTPGGGPCNNFCGADCAACGDNICAPGEDCNSCTLDCHSGVCGNNCCEPGSGESALSCSQDCGNPVCDHNGSCTSGETCGNCPDDCGPCPSCNNNTMCEPSLGESCASCVGDCCCNCSAWSSEPCGSNPAECGDQVWMHRTCTPAACQSESTCAPVCPRTGDGICQPSLGETPVNEPACGAQICNEAACTDWTDLHPGECGNFDCAPGTKKQYRDCSPQGPPVCQITRCAPC